MKTDKMSQETITALHKSIAHWNDICYGMEKNAGPGKCALCQEFSTPYGECRECPINTRSMRCYDKGSAYRGFTDARTGLDFCTVDSAEAAEAMLGLLVSLLPEGERRRRYDVGVEMMNGSYRWCMCNGLLNVSGVTGITTDGRNAFPQAKYVWEKVFEYQVCGPIPEMPEFKQVPMTATAIKTMWEEYDREAQRRDTLVHMPYFNWINYSRPLGSKPVERIWDTNAPKTKDGKCVTCGQVVKKKVVKYRVLFKSLNGWKLSAGYHESINSFAGVTESLRSTAILLKETAKEFDV